MDSQHSTDAEETPTSKDGEAVPKPLRGVLDEPIDTKLQLLKHHADMARLLAEEILAEDVEALAGKRHSRDRPCGKHLQRWGYNPGSIRIDGEKVPIEIPRLRDKDAGEEHTLESYQAMKEAEVGEELTDSILLGLSQGNYGRVASQFVDGFGLSQSSVSRRFQKRAQKALEEFENRSLEEENFLALWIDGKHVAGEQMIICMGVTEAGYKKVLGFTQATTERHEPIVELLRGLLDRGLSFEEGILCVVDGGRGLRKAIDEVFSGRAEVQRCQWHKRENVVSYLPKADQKKWRKKLQWAYQEPTYEAAKERLTGLHAELEQINRKAANSLMEGLEETLTLHRLGLFEELGRSLKTTNCIENLNEQVEGYTDNVKRWHHSPQRHRWMALSLLEAESRMRRLTGYKDLPKLKRALKDAIPDRE
ncbi:transposase-like protein [Salinibacter ruber]|uniref:IS256 family transposase n=1 Tax=Salinibacter ruber TaxID=146919 RepID=UPI00216906F0|nr:IS256 family transposase [Salinibacter ruber]MCS3668065.1 transposase-like protein [Salinibacter ruber]